MAGGVTFTFTPPAPGVDLSKQKAANTICAEVQKVADLQKKLKFDFSKFSVTLFGSILGGFMPPGLKKLTSRDSLLPRDLPFFSVSAMGAHLLTDPNVATSMMGLWNSVSQQAVTDVKRLTDGMSADLVNLTQSFDAMKATTLNTDLVRQAGDRVIQVLNDPNGFSDPSIFRSQVGAVCQALGGTSRGIFAAYDLASNFKASVTNLTDALTIPQMVSSAAGNLLTSAASSANSSIYRQLSNAGITGAAFDLSHLGGLSGKIFAGPCSPSALDELTVLRQACQAIDDFYSSEGLGSIDWGGLAQDFINRTSTAAMAKLANRATNTLSFTAKEITDPINSAVDDALRAAFCQGGNSETKNKLAAKIGTQVSQAISAAGTVATIYATGVEMTSLFSLGLSNLQIMGAGNAVNQIIGGNFDQFFNAGSAAVLGVEGTVLALQKCAASSNDPVVKAIAAASIKEVISKANLSGYLKVGAGDANKAQKLEEDKAKRFAQLDGKQAGG